MAVAPWKNNKQVTLETQKWKPLNIEGRSFLIKGIFCDNCYEILVSDYCTVWEESLSESDIMRRSKSINPLIEAPTSVILYQLSKRILENPQPLCTYSCQCTEDNITLSVDGPLQSNLGPHYQWNFILKKAPPLLLKSHLVYPLLSSSVELLHRNAELVKIIQRKDREINDYREGGAVVSRRHLQTAPFDLELFEEDMIKKREFKEYSLNPVNHLGAPQWQSLYGDIVTCRHWYTNNAIEAESPVPTPTQSPIKSPMKSPMKRSIESSPSKDVEKVRRMELEKRLEESKSKVKKKKKQLM